MDWNAIGAIGEILGAVAVAATLWEDPQWVLLTLIPLFVCGGVLLGLVRVTPAVAARVSRSQ